MSYRDVTPETFPGGGWYAPSVTASPQASALYARELGDEERADLERRERARAELGGFGFGRELEQLCANPRCRRLVHAGACDVP